MSEEAVIRVADLLTQFGSQVIHEGVDLNVRPGEVLGVVGGSGTGKSVLLRTILGLINRPPGESKFWAQMSCPQTMQRVKP